MSFTNSTESATVHRSIAIDWHSGPLEGFIEYPLTQEHFYFSFLKEASGTSAHIRIYSLRGITKLLFEEIVSSLEYYQEESFPIWFFSISENLYSQNELRNLMDQWIMKANSEIEWLMEWNLDENKVRILA